VSRRRMLALALGLGLALVFGPATAWADPIQSFIASYSDTLGLRTSSSIDLPDLATGGSVVLGAIPLVVQSSSSDPAAATPVSGTFQLNIGIKPPAGMQASSFDHIQYNGTLTGTVNAQPGSPPTFSGGFSGQVLGEQFPIGSYSEVPELYDLWSNMNRVHLSGQVITGAAGQPLLQTTLTVDSPEFVVPGNGNGGGGVAPQVPEPSTLAAFAVVFGAGLVVRSRRRRGDR
jgi:hypothetical protein